MSDENTSIDNYDKPGLYQIRIRGHLDSHWSGWFEGMNLTLENGDSVLTGPVTDQAALHGLLKKVRDASMPLISVTRIEQPTF